MMIGVDYHPSFQQIAFLIEGTGEYEERRLNHSDGEAEQFYRNLQLRGTLEAKKLANMESLRASFNSRKSRSRKMACPPRSVR